MACVQLPAGKSLRDIDATLSPRAVDLLHPELLDSFQFGDVAIAAGKIGKRACCKPAPRKIDKPFGRLQTFNKRHGDNVVVGLAEQVLNLAKFCHILRAATFAKKAQKEIHRVAQSFGMDAHPMSPPRGAFPKRGADMDKMVMATLNFVCGKTGKAPLHIRCSGSGSIRDSLGQKCEFARNVHQAAERQYQERCAWRSQGVPCCFARIRLLSYSGGQELVGKTGITAQAQ